MRYLVVNHLTDRGEYLHRVYEQGTDFTHFIADANGIDIYKNDYQIASFDINRLYYFKLVDPDVVYSDTGRTIIRPERMLEDSDSELRERIANKECLKLERQNGPRRVKASKVNGSKPKL